MKVNVIHIENDKEVRELISIARKVSPLRGRRIFEIFRTARENLKSDPQWLSRLKETDQNIELNDIISLFDGETWKTKLDVELPFPRALDQVYENTLTDVLLAYKPLGLVLHICPGNSYLGGVDSLLHGLITGNINLVRISRQTPPVAKIITELLEACGLPLGQSQILFWESGNDAIEKTFKAGVDGVIVWGGHEVVKAYRKDLPAGVKLIEYGPKLSVSVATVKGLENHKQLVGIAQDVCRYEQVSCSNTQALFVQMTEEHTSSKILEKLALAFKEYNLENPPPASKTKHTQIEILKALEHGKLLHTQSRGSFISGYPDWVIVFENESPVKPSPLSRTLFVYPFKDMDELKAKLIPIKHYLQTASLACDASEMPHLASELWSVGVNRVVEAGLSTVPSAGAPHDGGFILTQLSRVVSLEAPSRSKRLWQGGSDHHRLKLMREHLRTSSKAPFYRDRFKSVGLPQGEIQSWNDFYKIPFLLKDDFYKSGPPYSSDLLTTSFDKNPGAYLFTTGGSTGAPKYALYSRKEWDEVTDIFCQEYKLAGLTKNDRFANLFTGGGLWSAFIAVTEAAEKLGCLNLPIGSEMNPQEILKIFKAFKVSAVFGLPSTLLRLAHTVEENPELQCVIEKVLYGGEHMSEPMRQLIGRVFKSRVVKSGSYAAVDAGCIGYQCEHQSGAHHHALESYSHIEICDDETRLPVKPGEIGEIIVTNLSRKLFPIIRARTGDRGRQVLEKCPCGSTAFTFELLGRSDDMVRAGGANIFVSDVEKICTQFSDSLTMIYQVRISKVGADDSVEITIEARDFALKDHSFLEKVELSYKDTAEELTHYRDHGFLRHFKLSLVPEGSILGNNKTGKIRRVVDLR